jgi:hypothetical protein
VPPLLTQWCGDCKKKRKKRWRVTRNSRVESSHPALICSLRAWGEHRPDYNVADFSWVDPGVVENSLQMDERACDREAFYPLSRGGGFEGINKQTQTLRTTVSRSSGYVSLKPPRLALQMGVLYALQGNRTRVVWHGVKRMNSCCKACVWLASTLRGD